MFIHAFPCGPFETNAYLVASTSTKQAAIVDPSPGSFQVLVDYLAKHPMQVQKILLTHSHWDHIADVAQLKSHFQVPVYVHALDAPNLEKPGADGLPCWIAIEGVKPDGFLEEGGELSVGDLIFEVIHTPGHSPGSVCLYCPKEGFLLSGDTLFRGSIGNLALPSSQPEKMWPSLDKLAKLPKEVVVYPGHGPKTTIGNEHWLPRAREVFET